MKPAQKKRLRRTRDKCFKLFSKYTNECRQIDEVLECLRNQPRHFYFKVTIRKFEDKLQEYVLRRDGWKNKYELYHKALGQQGEPQQECEPQC